ncbi:MAG TPA: tRNA preQ1(34) S-adenosylmethionine ribosyltransferase-isomerase QueA [Candidatus Obscuribacterales bacterium]
MVSFKSMSDPCFQTNSSSSPGDDAATPCRLEDFEYDLPEELIAQEPLPVRHESRLMLVERASASITHHRFNELPELLGAGDVLVINDTRVIPARLTARRASGGLVSLLLIKNEAGQAGLWQAMASPIKRLREGEIMTVEPAHPEAAAIEIKEIVSGPDGHKRLVVYLGSQEQVYRLLSRCGYAPLPPYIRRDGDGSHRLQDLERYQTVFARAPGAVAAPTAGLHFSEEVMERLKERGIQVCNLTLHVGPGTFKPIATSLEEHSVEPEPFSIPEQTCAIVNAALAENRRVIAVGTTSCRALETAGAPGKLDAVSDASTSLYIRPGHDFRIISGLLTNFHLSRSSLLVLVSAFAGHDLIMRAYKEAVESRYRFFSYGDAMIIL